MDFEAEELHDGVEELDADEGEPIMRVPTYIPPWKGKAKVSKYPDLGKFMVSTPLLLKELVFEGMLLARILVLKLEDWYLVDHERVPHLATNKYMTKIYYEKTQVTRLKLMKWVKGFE